MKVSLAEIQAASPVLKRILDYPMDSKVAYWLNKDTKNMQKHLGTIEKLRGELFLKYGERDPNNVDRSRIKPENMETFIKEMTDALEQEVEVSMKPLDISVLGMKFSASDLDVLEKFIIIPEEWNESTTAENK